MRKSFIAIAAITAAFSLGSQAAAAPPFMCNGTFSGATYQDVIVPAGDMCSLFDTRITGNVTVQKGATFGVDNHTSQDTTIAGNIIADHCAAVNLDTLEGDINPLGGILGRIVVGGDVIITNCTSGASGADIGGNVKCDNNRASCGFRGAAIGGNVDCSGNGDGCHLNSAEIGKNVTLNNNGTGSVVDNSTIGGKINCAGNIGGVSDVGFPNTVAGTKSGQCSGF
jgi:hypothetical protein